MVKTIRTIELTGHLSPKTSFRQHEHSGLLYTFPKKGEMQINACTQYVISDSEEVTRSGRQQSIEQCIKDLEAWGAKYLNSHPMYGSFIEPNSSGTSCFKPDFIDDGKRDLEPVPGFTPNLGFFGSQRAPLPLTHTRGEITVKVREEPLNNLASTVEIRKYSISSLMNLNTMLAYVKSNIPESVQEHSLSFVI